MDHNNSDEKKCSCGASAKNCAFCQDCNCKKNVPEKSEKKHCACEHGMCKDHSPEWETISEVIVPNPGIFGQKTAWFKRCCKKGMTRLKKVRVQKCKKCGRIKEDMVAWVYRCECCGYTVKENRYTDDPGPGGSPRWEHKGGRNDPPKTPRPQIHPQPQKPHNKP